MSKRKTYPYGPSSRKKGLSSADWTGIVLLVLAMMAAGAVGYWYYTVSAAYVAYDKNTYCPESGPYARTVLLVDLTDEVTFIQEQKLRNFIYSLADPANDEVVPQHAMLSVYLLSESDVSSIPSPVIEVCNPGSGEGINEFTGNPRLANKRFRERYVEPINAAIGDVVHSDSSKTSPIIESIRGIALSEYSQEPTPGYAHRLIVISDMLQNTQNASHYRNGQVLNKDSIKNLRADLDSVERVDIKVIARDRTKNLQGKALVEYWREYFRASGTNLATAERWGE